MRTMMLALAIASCAPAQPAAPAGLTAEQIIEKSIAATGGREAREKSVSTYTKAIMQIGSGEENRSVMEFWAKAPNKRLIVMNIEEYGEVINGFDGRVGWTVDPIRGVRDVTGPELASLKRESVFRPELMWRQMYSKVELTGRRKVGDAEVYVVRLTQKGGRVETRFYDAKTFLLLRQDSFQDTPKGPVPLKTEMSDYRDVEGIKVPFRVTQTGPVGNMAIRVVEVKNNLAIDDAKFGRPAKRPAGSVRP